MTKLLVISLLALASSAVADEACLTEKLQVQQLLKQNAQLTFSAASQESVRLEALQKAEAEAKKATNGTTPPAAEPYGEHAKPQ